MQLVDAHCHLEADDFASRLPEVIREAAAVGVVHMVTAAVKPAQWSRARAIAAGHESVSFALGVHPWFANTAPLPAIMSMDTTGAVAVGEIGLDAAIETPSMETQMALFEAQLAVARDHALPVVIHCRRAFGELLHALKRAGTLPRGGVVHAFSGSAELVDALAPRGFYFSMGRSLTYHRSRKRDTVLARVYPDRLLLETDSPDMPPTGLERPNVPANLRHVLSGAAALLGEPEARIAEVTTANARRAYGLTP